MAGTTTNLDLQLLDPSQSQPEVPINDAFNKIDAAVHAAAAAPVILQLMCSDLVTALAVAASVAYARSPHAFTLTAVRASVLVASSSGLPTVDIKKNGVTVLSTSLSIDSGANTSVGAATPAVISVPAIADDDLLTVDITGAGTGTKGLIVTLIGHV